MQQEQSFINREKRFEIIDKAGFDTIVSRAGSEDGLFYAELIDFSRSGMKLNVPFFARFDEILKIHFDFKNCDFSYSGNLRVRHIRTIDENTWQVGCSSDPPLPEDLVSHFAEQNEQERRRFRRIDADGEGLLRREGSVATCEAQVINVSEGGFCLEIPRSHDIGERVDLSFPELDQEETIGGRVRWQKAVQGGFRVGCSFTNAESYDAIKKCVVMESGQQEPLDSFSPWLIAAALLAMLLPSLTYFLVHHGTSAEPVQQPAQVAAVLSQPDSQPNQIEQPTRAPQSPKAPQSPLPETELATNTTIESVGVEGTDEKSLDEKHLEEMRAAELETKPGKTSDKASKRNAIAQRSATEKRRAAVGNASAPTAWSTDLPAKTPNTKRRGNSRISTSANRPAKVRRRAKPGKTFSSPVPAVIRPSFESIPRELTHSQRFETIVTQPTDSQSTRRIKPKRPVTVPSEEIEFDNSRRRSRN